MSRLPVAALLLCLSSCGPPPAPSPPAPPASGAWQPAPAQPAIGATDLPAETPPAAAAPADDDLEFCVAQTNRYRAGKGKPPVRRSRELEAYAAKGAAYDTRARTPHKHFADTNGGNLAFAENECLSFQGWTLEYSGGTVRAALAKCLQAFYDEGPGGGHYENMMGDYATLGCAIHRDGDGVSIVQDFGL